MKNRTLSLVISLFILINGMVYSFESIYEHPSETMIFKLPDNSEGNWKEISHYVTKTEGIIERIPLNQTINKWSDLICMQYFDISTKNEKARNDIQVILDNLKKVILSRYPKKQTTWKIIEKTKKDVIYEWILHKPYQTIRPQHEIVRAILTNTSVHLIGFTKKNEIMSGEEREKWINLLKENISIISFQEGIKSKGLSLANKLKDSLSLGSNFRDWRIENVFSLNDGFTLVCYIPPSQLSGYITECLEVITKPNVQERSLDQFLESEKALIQEKFYSNIQVLEKSQKEVIYAYSYPKNNLKVNAIIRTFLTDHAYYSINYKHGFEGLMGEEESLKWQEKLKIIHVKNQDSVED